MQGPYFKGQKPEACGCYYPDVTRIRDRYDNEGKGIQVLFCYAHGICSVKLVTPPEGDEEEIPAEEWREKEKKRLQKCIEKLNR